MPLKDLLHKKNKIKDEGASGATEKPSTLSPDVPEFTFMRTTTHTQETFDPPSYPGDPTRPKPQNLSPEPRGLVGRLRRHSNASSPASPNAEQTSFAERMHFGRSRSSSSVNVPANLPEVGGDGVARNEEEEAKWEKRATVLVTSNSVLRSGTTTPNVESDNPLSPTGKKSRSRAPSVTHTIQEAIRLHETGNLEASTAMFGKLADPNGPNNALSQVLYGLALRHGWGCIPDQEQAIKYLSMAANNSAEVEKIALDSGVKKGGAAKGELVLAMYELANCYRNGWGIKKDPVAAKQYYETAANLGDTDAMNEVAWCYLEGFGTKKDKFKAAQFLRLAESKGSKTLGNTW
ncbi:HCP-like protein [Lentithecium fluviatile CBS 122367]|uniref:HCP-like protein n=1 Tax=Lentithecium fluviatile CBS 122367 TaxID=1168545 RepID=A0A6G1IWD5_9PLEO|nr:HCP-like protein [Lentithecium fluviatile CBS 122367]